jgi:8-amino-7-oxononanoate synthase
VRAFAGAGATVIIADVLDAEGAVGHSDCGPSLLVGEDERALALQQQLERAGLLAVAIRPPTVPAGTARLRLVLRQDLPKGSLRTLLAALGPGPCPARRHGNP